MTNHTLVMANQQWGRILSLIRTKNAVLALFPFAMVVVLFKMAISDGGRDVPTLAFAQTGLLIAAALVVASGAARSTHLTRPVGLMTLALALASFRSVRPDSSLREVLSWVTYLSVLIATPSAIHTWTGARRFLDGLVVIAGWVGLVGWYIFWGADNPGMRWYSTFYWPNPFAGFLLLFIPLEIARLAHARSMRDASAHGTMAALLLIPFVLTYSRGAWMSLLGTSLVSLFILKPPSWAGAIRRLLVVGGVTILLVIMLTRGGALRPTPQAVLGRAVSVANAGDYSIRGRLNFWRVGLEILRDHPVVGTGPGTYAYSSAAYQRDIRYFAKDAHNLYVQTAAEAGGIGVAAIGWLLFALVGLARRTLQTARGTPEYPLVAGVILGLAAFFMHSALDMNWQFPINGAMAFALMGVLAWCDSSRALRTVPSPDATRGYGWRIPATAVLVGIAVIVQVLYAADRSFSDGRTMAFSGRWVDAAPKFRLASRLNPLDPKPPSALADTLKRIAPRQDEEVAALIRRSMALDRMNAYYPLQLARLVSGRMPLDGTSRAQAEDLIEQALTLDPFHYPEGYMMLARLHYEAGDAQAAEAVYQRARAKYPPGFAQDEILRSMLWPGVARLYMDWANFLAFQGRFSDAHVVYQRILAEDPRYVPAYLAKAELLLRESRAEEAGTLLGRGLEAVPASEALWRAWRSRSAGGRAIWPQ